MDDFGNEIVYAAYTLGAYAHRAAVARRHVDLENVEDSALLCEETLVRLGLVL